MTSPPAPGNLRPTQRCGERSLLRRFGELLDSSANLNSGSQPAWPNAVPFGDDMAVLAPDSELLWSVDLLMDGVDFDSRRHAWHDIGFKAMAVNISDCAAMGCMPVSALVALALADTVTQSDAIALMQGVIRCGATHGCRVTGGDTNSWPNPTAVSVAICGRPALPDGPVRRDGAHPGERIFLTGPVGGSILGRHLTPTPRVAEAIAIGRWRRPSAMIDVSDGLALDLWRVCEASGCGARIENSYLTAAIHADAVRLAATTGRPPVEHALGDGEDFELIVVLAPETTEADAARLGLLPLGRMIAEPRLELAGDGGIRALEPTGWEHFR